MTVFLYTVVTKMVAGLSFVHQNNARDLLSEVDNANSSYVKYGYDTLGRKVFWEEAQVDLNKLASQNSNGITGSN